MNSKREATSSLDSLFWENVRSRVERIQDLTLTHSIDLPKDLLRSTQQLVDSKPNSTYSKQHHLECPSPKPFDASSYIVHESPRSDLSITSEAPSQISFSNMHSNLPHSYEDEISRVKDESKIVQSTFSQRISAFRSASKSCVNNNFKLQAELDWYREEMKKMKRSVVELLEETQKSKKELEKARENLAISQSMKMRSKTYTESPEIDYSVSRISHKDSVSDKIIELHQELNALSDKLLQSEECRLRIEKDNQKIRKLITRLEETLPYRKQEVGSEILIEKEADSKGCSDSCYIF